MAETKLTVGAEAPAFTLPDQDGRPVSLADFAGRWVVVYFYPRDDTPGCTTEACEFTEGLAGFAELDAVVVGVSPDPPERHRAFRAKYDLGVTLLSDVDRAVMTRYGAFGEKQNYGKVVQGVIRSTVVVDPRGRVAHHWRSVRAKGHAARVREVLHELRGD